MTGQKETVTNAGTQKVERKMKLTDEQKKIILSSMAEERVAELTGTIAKLKQEINILRMGKSFDLR